MLPFMIYFTTFQNGVNGTPKWALLKNGHRSLIFRAILLAWYHSILVWTGFLWVKPRCEWCQGSRWECSLISEKAGAYQDRALSTLWILGGAQVLQPEQEHGPSSQWQGNSPLDVPSQAGNGAGSKPGNILDVLTQYRGLSWR